MTMLKLSLRSIRANIGRLILTGIAIVAGVGFVSGSFILSDSLAATFNQIFESAGEEVDARVLPAEPDFGDVTVTMPDTIIADLEALPEVERVTATVGIDPGESFRPFIAKNAEGEPVEPQGPPIITFSWDGVESDALGTGEGRAPAEFGEVMLNTEYVEALGVSIGDEVDFQTPDGEQTFTLVGAADFGVTAGAYFVIFDFDSAQQLYDKEGLVDSIDLASTATTSTEDLITAALAVVPDDVEVIDQQAAIAEDQSEFNAFIGIFRNALLAFAGVALFVSLFIIYNTFAILVSQRLREIGMLRAIGATASQIRRSVALEAILIGLFGSILGMGFGLIVANLIKAAFQATGGFPETGTVFATRTVIVSLLVGVLATLVSALGPMRQAAKITPIEAMRSERPDRGNRRTIIGGIALGLGLVLLALGLFGSLDSVAALLSALAVGAILTFVGVSLLSALFAGGVVAMIGRPPVLGVALLLLGLALPVLMFTTGDGLPGGIFSGFLFGLKILVSAAATITGLSILASLNRGTPLPFGSAAGLDGEIAMRNASRSPQRTAATATALTIGIALIATVGVVGESLKESFVSTLDRAVSADLFIFDEETNSPFSGELADEVEQVDGVGAVSRFRFNEIRIGTDIDNVGAFEAATGSAIIDFDVTEGSVEALVGDSIMVWRDTAEDRAIFVGDVLPVEFPNDDGPVDLTVTAIFDDNSVLGSPFVVDLATYAAQIDSTDDIFVGAAYAEGADTEAVKAEVVGLADTFGSVSAQDNAEFRQGQEDQVNQLITLINAMLGFALFVAFLGVINTIVLSVIERTREIGLLRAVGMTRDQLKSSIRWEAVIVCLFGALLGIVLGTLFAWAAVTAIPDSVVSTIAIPFETIAFTILVAALAGVLAAFFPARRAAKMPVLDAIAAS